MARPKVSDDSKQYRTEKVGYDDPSRLSESTASCEGWNALSFLRGSCVDGGTNDMGADSASPFGSPGMSSAEYESNYRARRDLQRHTIDQGMSTFSWPQKP